MCRVRPAPTATPPPAPSGAALPRHLPRHFLQPEPMRAPVPAPFPHQCGLFLPARPLRVPQKVPPSSLCPLRPTPGGVRTDCAAPTVHGAPLGRQQETHRWGPASQLPRRLLWLLSPSFPSLPPLLSPPFLSSLLPAAPLTLASPGSGGASWTPDPTLWRALQAAAPGGSSVSVTPQPGLSGCECV